MNTMATFPRNDARDRYFDEQERTQAWDRLIRDMWDHMTRRCLIDVMPEPRREDYRPTVSPMPPPIHSGEHLVDVQGGVSTTTGPDLPWRTAWHLD